MPDRKKASGGATSTEVPIALTLELEDGRGNPREAGSQTGKIRLEEDGIRRKGGVRGRSRIEESVGNKMCMGEAELTTRSGD